MTPHAERARAGVAPATHYELFAGLRDARVSYLLRGNTALVLHGVPRLAPGIEIVADASPDNVVRLEGLLSAWGYGEATPSASLHDGETRRRFENSTSALAPFEAVLSPPAEFGRLCAGSATARLVDLEIPLLGVDELRLRLERSGDAAEREDAASLRFAAALRGGSDERLDGEARREQIRKFSRWSVAARLDWLLAGARLEMGLAPESRPMTRGLVRRRWFPGR